MTEVPERFERNGEIIEIRDGREFHVSLVEGMKVRRKGGRTKVLTIGDAVVLHRKGGRMTPCQEQHRAKRQKRYRSSAYRLKTMWKDRNCRWCGTDLPAGTEALVRWCDDRGRYSFSCFDCGDKRGYKVMRGGKHCRPKPQATNDDLRRLQAHWSAR